MAGMVRFSLKDILRGLTLASIGFGMLAVGFRMDVQSTPKVLSLTEAFLVAFGGMFVGYGLAFPVKYPPQQMALAMVGMFAATSWRDGSSLGLLFYVGLTAVLW